eukprot:COSAG02_NODE_676_length_18610_cov_44.695532_12_plen_145_part_00
MVGFDSSLKRRSVVNFEEIRSLRRLSRLRVVCKSKNGSYQLRVYTGPPVNSPTVPCRVPVLPTEPCVLRTFGHDGKLNTCAQSVPKKFRDRLRADKKISERSRPPNVRNTHSSVVGVRSGGIQIHGGSHRRQPRPLFFLSVQST